MQLTSAAVLIALALTVFSFCYYYFTTRHKERMTILEKGLPPDFFSRHFSIRPTLLVLGLVLIGLSMGVIFGGILGNAITAINKNLVLAATLFAFTGISLLIGYLILKKNK